MTAAESPFGDLLQDYIVECLPLAEQVGDAFVELERRWQSGEPGDDLLTTVKGRLHTIKGNSAMMGIAPARDVAHALEDACGFLGRAADARTADAAQAYRRALGAGADGGEDADDGPRRRAGIERKLRELGATARSRATP